MNSTQLKVNQLGKNRLQLKFRIREKSIFLWTNLGKTSLQLQFSGKPHLRLNAIKYKIGIKNIFRAKNQKGKAFLESAEYADFPYWTVLSIKQF